MRALLLLLLLAPPFLSAEDPWTERRAQNPPELEFSLKILDPHTYRQRELIRAEAVLATARSDSDELPEEIWGLAGLLLSPSGECGTVEHPCTMPFERFRRNDPMPGMRRSRPAIIFLNSQLPVLAPGRYQVALLARKQVLKRRRATSASFGPPDPEVFAVSNAVELEIAATTAEWIRQTVSECARVLSAPESQPSEGYEARRAAAEQLSYLDHPAAWSASLDALPLEQGRLLPGLSLSAQPDRVCQLMRERLSEPKQVVSYYYVAHAVTACRRVDLPDPPDASTPEDERTRYFEMVRSFDAVLLPELYDQLAASLGDKEPAARISALETLIQRVRHLQLNEPNAPEPEWTSTLRREFIDMFPTLGRQTQRRLIRAVSGTFAWPELVPAFESILDAWSPGDYYEASHEALAALCAIDPEKAQKRILGELCKPKTWIDVQSLDLLPASAVPEMDDGLIDALTAAQQPGGWNPQLRMAAVAKYATPGALPRIRAIYESQQDRCQPELMAYFVRVDPEYAESVFRSHEWDMHSDPPQCTLQYFERTAPLAMGQPLEDYMAAYLMHGLVYVKQTAARALAQYGSPAAVAPLWEAFRYFHEYWQDRGEPNQEGAEFEKVLRDAVAHGRNWFTGPADLRLLESICISGQCVGNARTDLSAWEGTPRIEIQPYEVGLRASVAQYWNIETLADLKAKLAQFPRGIRFVLVNRSPLTADAAAEIRQFAGQRGLIVTDQETTGAARDGDH